MIRSFVAALCLCLTAVLPSPALAEAKPAADELSWSYFNIERVSAYLDGGTVRLQGRLGAEPAEVRYDLEIGSPTRGKIFIRRGQQPEVEADPQTLRSLQEAIKYDMSGRGALRSVARAISDRLVVAGLEKRNPDPFLRSFRVTNVDKEGFPRGTFKLDGMTKNGPRMFFVNGKKVLFQPPSYEIYALAPRPLASTERRDLLRVLSRAAIERLPNNELRAKAWRLRKLVAAEHRMAR